MSLNSVFQIYTKHTHTGSRNSVWDARLYHDIKDDM